MKESSNMDLTYLWINIFLLVSEEGRGGEVEASMMRELKVGGKVGMPEIPVMSLLRK